MSAAVEASPPRYRLLKLCARIGSWFRHAPSMVLLGAIYESEGGDDAVDSANRLYRRAAERGDAQAMWSLGVNHLSCKGGATDTDEAVYWLARAADHEHDLASWALGKMYLAGNTVEKDVQRGLELLRRGAERGHKAACQTLAEIYAEGQFGLTADPDAARQWAARAEHGAPPPGEAVAPAMDGGR